MLRSIDSYLVVMIKVGRKNGGNLDMKVLGIVCSPRKGGNTETMMKEALSGAGSYGADF